MLIDLIIDSYCVSAILALLLYLLYEVVKAAAAREQGFVPSPALVAWVARRRCQRGY